MAPNAAGVIKRRNSCAGSASERSATSVSDFQLACQPPFALARSVRLQPDPDCAGIY
jgi:hypothetical protein